MGNKMMWIVSGPTCVGKSYFLWSKKDRLSEITNLPPFTYPAPESKPFLVIDLVRLIHEFRASKLIKTAIEDPYLLGLHAGNKQSGVSFIWNADSYGICVHLEVLGVRKQREQKVAYNIYWKEISELKTRKRVIILGVPYSKYKSRFKQRSSNNRDKRLESYAQILELYKNWIGELNKKEIPYFLVESFGAYKIVREDDFFKMLKL
jgi:hypothetical protein